jgi:poly(A) polymerase/tRNA nucleotidyltransferase (CCA-adding enzyme)
MFSIPASLEELAREFRKHGRQCYLVGGAIRDMLLGRPSTDYDIATDALPQEVQGMFRRVIPTGLKHGTVTVLFRDCASR